MSLSVALGIIRAADAAVLALPTFKALIKEIGDTFDSDRDQDELKAAYETALAGAEDAHQAAQDAVRDHG